MKILLKYSQYNSYSLFHLFPARVYIFLTNPNFNNGKCTKVSLRLGRKIQNSRIRVVTDASLLYSLFMSVEIIKYP